MAMENDPKPPMSRSLCVGIQQLIMCLALREPHKAAFCEDICRQLEREFPEPPKKGEAEGGE